MIVAVVPRLRPQPQPCSTPFVRPLTISLSLPSPPLSLCGTSHQIVGQEAIKQALLLGTINSRMGGIAISGGRGTAKSVMARALHRIMPPIEVVKDSEFNLDPELPGEADDFLKDKLAAAGTDLEAGIEALGTEVIPCPFVQVPLNVMEDRLLGSVNVEQSVRTGKTVFEPGKSLEGLGEGLGEGH